MWEFRENEELKSVIKISDSLLTIYFVSISECDTFYSKNIEARITDIKKNKSDVLLSLTSEGETFYSSLQFTDDNQGKFCFIYGKDTSCSIIYSTDNKIIRKDKSQRLTIGFKGILKYDIENSEEKFKRIIEGIELSHEGLDIINYIDSLREDLLHQYGLNYHEVSNWKCIDSILAYKSPSIFLVGKEPSIPIETYFSASTLKKKIIQYLVHTSNQIDVKVFFPYFEKGKNPSLYWMDPHTNWESGLFYHQLLGRSLFELNEIKVNISQIERMIDSKS